MTRAIDYTVIIKRLGGGSSTAHLKSHQAAYALLRRSKADVTITHISIFRASEQLHEWYAPYRGNR